MLKALTKLDRYIISEFWLPLAFGVGIITGVWLGIDKFKDIFKLLAKSGASFIDGMVVIGLEIPEILSMTIPISILIATFLVFQKLSGHSEIIAMRAAGISFQRILVPVVFMGFAAAAVTFALSEFVVPVASPLARKMYALSLYKKPVPTKSSESFSYFEKDQQKRIRRIFYVRSIKDDVLKHITIVDFTKKGISQIHTALEGNWSPEQGGWELRTGSTRIIKSRNPKKENQGTDLVSNFDSTFVPSTVNPMKILGSISKFRDMNFLELKTFVELHDNETIETSKFNEALTMFHTKFSYPISCVLLALIGACLGVIGRRKTINFGYIILGMVVFIFYMSQTIFDSFGDSGKMLAMLAAWMPNIIIGSIALGIVAYRVRN